MTVKVQHDPEKGVSVYTHDKDSINELLDLILAADRDEATRLLVSWGTFMFRKGESHERIMSRETTRH